jgi:hypothetical protein
MAKITWQAIKIILGIAMEIVDLVKDKLMRNGGKHDSSSANPKAE